MKIWNFKSKEMEEARRVPKCNGIGSSDLYVPLIVSFNNKDNKTFFYLGKEEIKNARKK